MWWRALVPSWNFFDSTGLEPALLVRVHGEWKALPNQKRGALWTLFFNPGGTAQHARENLYSRLLIEASGTLQVQNLVSFKLVYKIAEHFAHAHGEKQVCFKVMSGTEEGLVHQ